MLYINKMRSMLLTAGTAIESFNPVIYPSIHVISIVHVGQKRSHVCSKDDCQCVSRYQIIATHTFCRANTNTGTTLTPCFKPILLVSPAGSGNTQLLTRMDSSLADISSLPATSKTTAFLSLLDRTLSTPYPSSNDLSSFITAVTQDSIGLVVSRQVVAAFVKRLPEIKERNVKKQVAERALEAVQARQASFEEQVRNI